MSQRAILVLFCLLLLWAPMPLGSNREWSLSLLFAAMGALLAVWGFVSALSPSISHSRQGSLWPAAILLAIGLCVAGVQIVDLKMIDAQLGTRLAADFAHPAWGMASEALATNLPAYVSIDPFASASAIGKVSLYAAAFWLAFQMAQHKSGASAILWSVALSGGLNVLIGIVEGGARIDVGSWLSGEPPIAQTRFNGTFVNPNNFATFAAMAMIAAMALCIPIVSDGIVLNRGREIARRTIINTVTGPALPVAATILALAGSITLSGSRAGTLAMLVGSTVLALCLHRWTAAAGKSTGDAAANVGILAIVGIGLAVAAAPLALRLSTVEFESDRSQIASDTIDAIAAAPWTGNGFGAFERYFPSYASAPYPNVVNAAHNDYLEMLADLGLAGGGALIFAVLFLTVAAFQGVLRRRRTKHFAAAAVAASALCGFHSYFDFSLQIPAVGLTLFSLLGAGVAQSWPGRVEPNDERSIA